jgi:hypothetical protein
MVFESDLYGCKSAFSAELDDDVDHAKTSFLMEDHNRFGEENHRLCQKLIRDLFAVYSIITGQPCGIISAYQESA